VIQKANPDRLVGLQGTYAGFVTRFGGFLIDIIAIAGLFTLAAHAFDYVVSAVVGHEFALADSHVASAVLLVSWAFLYCAYPLAVGGRTVGMAMVGTRAVRTDGSEIGTRQAVIRVITFPLSFLLLGFGFILILLKRDRRALHDLFAGTAVVYGWDARAAQLRFLARQPHR
jgi:uncharacterized RDD family membrane protein YckC